jgi:hypothetical protein
MEHEELVAAVHEMTDFATQTASVLQDHKKVLGRHEANLQAEYRAGVSHADAIRALRSDMQGLRDLVAAQTELVSSMQRVLVRITNSLGLPPDEPLPGAIN